MKERVGELLGKLMSRGKPVVRIALLIGMVSTAWAGPPFQTDDPEPIEYKHYEFYTFGSASSAPGETDTLGPAFEFNWGALPNVHLHVIVPAAAIVPSMGPKVFGIGDIELGIKYRFVQESKHRPMIGTFVMFEVPSGNADKGLGVGKTWYKLPLWAQKSLGPWTTYGGGGVTVVDAPGYRNYPFAGWLVQRDLPKKLTLATELFYHGPEGEATPFNRPSTLVDVGGYYKFRDPGFQLLFCYGHSVIGHTESYAYLGLYWTWPEKKDDPDKPGDAGDKTKPAGMAFGGMTPPIAAYRTMGRR
jgi:hypothetical protein